MCAQASHRCYNALRFLADEYGKPKYPSGHKKNSAQMKPWSNNSHFIDD